VTENEALLRDLLVDVFLLEPDEYHRELLRADVETWDSLGIVSLAVGIEETFGYHMTPEEATGLTGVADIVTLLASKGIGFGD
jgi:acyl carrier protein